MVTRRKKPLSTSEVSLKYGFRSGLEEKVAEYLASKGVGVSFETLKVPYVKPETKHIYTPDFILDNGIIIETKGRWMMEDRKKHVLIRKQHPNLDIRILFQNANAKISKGSSSASSKLQTQKNTISSACGINNPGRIGTRPTVTP